MMNSILFRYVLLAASMVVAVQAAEPEVLALEGDLTPIHDPAMARRFNRRISLEELLEAPKR